MNETLVRLFLFYNKEQQIRKQLQGSLTIFRDLGCNLLFVGGGWGSGEDAEATLVNLV